MTAPMLLLFGVTVAAPAVQQPRVEVALRSRQVYLGEPFGVSVLLHDLPGDPAPPDVSGWSQDFEVHELGRQGSSQSLSVVGGRFRRRQTVRYDYELTPKTAGDADGVVYLPTVAVTADGKEYRSRPRTLLVKPPDEPGAVVVRIEADPPRPYVRQPVTLRLVVESEPVRGNLRTDPLLSLVDEGGVPQQLQVSWLSDDRLPEGLAPVVPEQSWLRDHADDAVGFGVNGVGRGRLGGGVFLSGVLWFEPDLIERPRSAEGVWRHVLERRFVPDRVGTFELPAATLRGGHRIDRESYDSVFVRSQPFTLEVRGAPDDRPPSFSGAVGSFILEADLDRRRIQVGEPVQLTLDLRGIGDVGRVAPPDLAADPAVAAEFRVYPPTETVTDRGKRFVYTLRPRSEAVASFPPVSLTYFDTQTERFESIETLKLPVTVVPADGHAGSEPPAAEAAAAPTEDAPPAGGFPDLRWPADQRIDERRPLAMIAAMVALYLLVWFALRTAKSRAGVNRAAAARDARRLLESGGGPDTVLRSFRIWAGALTGDTGDGLTAAEIDAVMRSRGLSGEAATQVGALLGTCEQARYGGAVDAPDRALPLLDEAIRQTRKGQPS